MNIFTFKRYGDINIQYLIRILVIIIHFIELKLNSINSTIFNNVGIYWSLVEFILVLLKRRKIDNIYLLSDNLLGNIIQSLIRGYSEGGVFTSIGKYYSFTPVTTILLVFSSALSYKISKKTKLTSKREVKVTQILLTMITCIYYITKSNKTYSIKYVIIMSFIGFLWNLIGDFVKAREAEFITKNNLNCRLFAYLYDGIFEIGLLYGGLAELPNIISFFKKYNG